MRLSLSQFDFVGASLLLAASALIVFAVQTAGTGSHSWSSGDVIVALVVGCTCWALLFSWEYLLEKARWSGRIASVFPYTVWTNRVLISGTVYAMLISKLHQIISNQDKGHYAHGLLLLSRRH